MGGGEGEVDGLGGGREVGRSSQKKNWVQGWRDKKKSKKKKSQERVRARGKKKHEKKKTTDQVN
jgi:hypothetical protein